MQEEQNISQESEQQEPDVQQIPECGGCCEVCEACPSQQAAPPQTEDTPVEVVDIRFRNNAKSYYFDPDGLTLTPGSCVIIDTARGDEFGVCSAGNHIVRSSELVMPLRKVIRPATEQDERTNRENEEKERRAYDICLQKIRDHGLDMQLVSAECAFDGSKILFFFTAEGRVDFRELVKDLASAFRTRIELRQIGVRDKAKMVGGLGVCGRPFCCRAFLDDFQPVSIKMAKTQNLSLNPTKISGTCGRLMCCLKYEQEAYEDLLKTAPKNESFVDTPDGRGTVTEVNLLRQSVKVRMEDHPETVGSYKNSDIYVIRSGKARKTDPPIPKDFAPISSRPRPAAKKEAELEPLPEVIFADASLNAEQQDEPGETGQTAEQMQMRRRRKRRGKGRSGGAENPPETEAAQQETRLKMPKTPREQPKQEQEQEPAAQKSSSRRRRGRRRSGGSGKGETPQQES